jgi:DNA-binding response OmpR family regulator
MDGKKKILLIEDDDQLRATLRDKLYHVYDVYEAADGEEGIAKCLDNHPDVIVLDLLLPKLDGLKVLERIRSYPEPGIAKTHVVVLSNLWSQKDILQVQGLKVDDYFVKAHTKIEDVVARIGVVVS